MSGGGSGSGDRQPRPQATRGQRQQQAASLPLDIVAEIAACSDPVTLVRCAATCWEMRRRVADDPAFRRRLRLRHADRFVPSLLHGFFAGRDDYFKNKSERYLVDTTAVDATQVRMVNLSAGLGPTFPAACAMESRDGLVLLVSVMGEELRVWSPATGRSQDLPSEPTFPTDGNRWPYNYVLLASDNEGGGAGAVGRPFQLLNAKIDWSKPQPHLQIHTFSSVHDTWGPITEILIPNLYGSYLEQKEGGLVVGGAVHWLCSTDRGSCIMKLHIRSAQVTISELPESFPRYEWQIEYLLATTSSSGSPIVLVNEGGKISAWSQSKQTMKWNQQPQQVTDVDELMRFALSNGAKRLWRPRVNLKCFAERSGLVLIRITDCGRSGGFIWLDLQTLEMVRWFSDPLLETAVCVDGPYEIDISSWIPNFSSTL